MFWKSECRSSGNYKLCTTIILQTFPMDSGEASPTFVHANTMHLHSLIKCRPGFATAYGEARQDSQSLFVYRVGDKIYPLVLGGKNYYPCSYHFVEFVCYICSYNISVRYVYV